MAQEPNDSGTPEKHVEESIPPCDGLYPQEVLILSCAERYFVSGNDFPRFWLYKYDIDDVQSVLDSLLQRGYTNVGTIKDAIMSESLPTIREELKKHDLSTKGKKEDLVQRLVDNVSEDELSKIFTKRPYILSDLGAEIVKKYEWIPYIDHHAIEDLDIWSLTQLVQDSNNKGYRDCIWDYLQSQSLKHFKDRNYGLYRNCLFEMAQFVEEEGKLEEAFELLCEVCVYDLNYDRNNFEEEYLDKAMVADMCFPYEKSDVKLAPGIITLLRKYRSRLYWDMPTTREKIEYVVKDMSVPFRIFSNDECVNIILDELEVNTDEAEKIYEKAEKRFRKKYNLE